MVKGYSEQRWLKITIEQIKAVKHSDREVPKTLICKSKTTWHQLVKTFFQACHVIYYNFWHFVACCKQRGCVSRDFSQALWTRGSWQSCILSLCHDFSWGWGHLMASSDVPTSPRSFYLPVGSESSFLCSWFYSTTATDPAGVRDEGCTPWVLQGCASRAGEGMLVSQLDSLLLDCPCLSFSQKGWQE